MARPLRTAAVLSLCAILIPAGCDSPISPPEVAPSAAVTGNGTVISTVKDVVPIDGHFVSGECLNDGEPFATNGALAVTHHLSLSPTLDLKTFQMKLSTVVLPEGVSLVGVQSAEELVAVGADKAEVTEVVTLPTTLDEDVGVGAIINDDASVVVGNGRAVEGSVEMRLTVEIGEDFRITTTVEDVQLVCPPPGADDGTIIVTKQDKLDVDTKVTTPCFNDGVEEEVAISGVLGVVNHLKLTPTDGQTYLMDLSTVVWSEGIQLVGLASAAEALVVGAEKQHFKEETTLPQAILVTNDWESLVGESAKDLDSADEGPSSLVTTLEVEIREDHAITTTLDKIEILCPPPPVVDN